MTSGQPYLAVLGVYSHDVHVQASNHHMRFAALPVQVPFEAGPQQGG